MYAPYKNTFYAPMRCSQVGDPCSTSCMPNCVQGTPMTCNGSMYARQRNMGVCYPTEFKVGDACVAGQCGPHLYCQQTLDVDSRPNSAPSFAAPDVGAGYCAPLSTQPRTSKTFSFIQ